MVLFSSYKETHIQCPCSVECLISIKKEYEVGLYVFILRNCRVFLGFNVETSRIFLLDCHSNLISGIVFLLAGGRHGRTRYI